MRNRNWAQYNMRQNQPLLPGKQIMGHFEMKPKNRINAFGYLQPDPPP
ncbi:MAG: hypothetical protein ACR2LM_14670 [Pyrinomonadaceae bacterium]